MEERAEGAGIMDKVIAAVITIVVAALGEIVKKD